MRWTWEVVLQISTFVGGITGVLFLYDRYIKPRKKRQQPVRKLSPNELLFQELEARHKKKNNLETVFKDWELRWTAIHYLVSSICFGLVSFWFGFGGQALFFLLGGVPSGLISHFLGKTGRHEKAEGVFLYGACFSAGAGFLAMMLGGGLCYFNGDPNADHLAGSGFAIISGVFCFLEAVVCTYLMVRWA